MDAEAVRGLNRDAAGLGRELDQTLSSIGDPQAVLSLSQVKAPWRQGDTAARKTSIASN